MSFPGQAGPKVPELIPRAVSWQMRHECSLQRSIWPETRRLMNSETVLVFSIVLSKHSFRVLTKQWEVVKRGSGTSRSKDFGIVVQGQCDIWLLSQWEGKVGSEKPEALQSIGSKWAEWDFCWLRLVVSHKAKVNIIEDGRHGGGNDYKW